MARTVSIVGAGRVGRTLGRCLHRLGWGVESVISRSDAHARAAVRWIGAGKPGALLARDIFTADLLLLATPDAALAQVAKRLAHVGRTRLRGKVVLHTSGALDRGVLRPLARCGAATGSLHPMQTFTGTDTPNLKGVIFAVEGQPRACRLAGRIARELGGKPVAIGGRKKAAYHAAGALVAGHALALVEGATEILMRLGFTRGRAREALLPLMRQMLDNFERVGPERAWTGPLSRGDYAIIAAHARALKSYPREFSRAYAALAYLSGRVLAADSATTIALLRRALGPPSEQPPFRSSDRGTARVNRGTMRFARPSPEKHKV
ncbi:MAG TPA: DUF2520 domain-containing protein [Candidatus Cybelea sp.]|nr:DUF2520 domain-containing protein [Candidatus Cybelea sp.]